jgi:hypothetical protein
VPPAPPPTIVIPRTAPLCQLRDVYISEAHGQYSQGDYIEVTNCGAAECSLSGFQLDDSDSMSDLTFASTVNVAAGQVWMGYKQ